MEIKNKKATVILGGGLAGLSAGFGLVKAGRPVGRIHEPKNWSPHMAPEGKTHIVAEYFCFKGDKIWNSSDEELTSQTAKQLKRL